MDSQTVALISAASGLAGAILGGGGVGGVLTAVFKHRLESRQMEHDHSHDLIETLSGRIRSLEERDDDCQRKNAELSERLGRLSERLDMLDGGFETRRRK